MGFLDIRIEKTERAIKQAFMELRREKPVEKIRVKELCDRACINKSTFYAHYQDIYALANAMEDEMVHAVVERLPRQRCERAHRVACAGDVPRLHRASGRDQRAVLRLPAGAVHQPGGTGHVPVHRPDRPHL